MSANRCAAASVPRIGQATSCDGTGISTAALQLSSITPFRLVHCHTAYATCILAVRSTSRCPWAAYRTRWSRCSSAATSISIAAGHLPASLKQLELGHCYNQPLIRGVLPAGLRRLHLGGEHDQPLIFGSGHFDQHLRPSVLPPQLQLLSICTSRSHPLTPGVIPPSVTHLRLHVRIPHPLQVGSIPLGVTHLDISSQHSHSLPPGVLPASLRELSIKDGLTERLQIGSLPYGLERLTFHRPQTPYSHVLQPGLIPASVTLLSLGRWYEEELVAGGIPATVQWLVLPRAYSRKDLSGVVSAMMRTARTRKRATVKRTATKTKMRRTAMVVSNHVNQEDSDE